MELDFGRGLSSSPPPSPANCVGSGAGRGAHRFGEDVLVCFNKCCLLAFSPSSVLRPRAQASRGGIFFAYTRRASNFFRLLIPAFTVFGSAMNCTKLSLSTHSSASFALSAPPPYIIMRLNILPAIGGCSTHVTRAVIPLSEIPLVEADEGSEAALLPRALGRGVPLGQHRRRKWDRCVVDMA